MSRINQVPLGRPAAHSASGNPAPQYDLSKPPQGKTVNTTAIRKFADNMKSFQNYSREAVAGIVVGGQVAVK